MTNFALNQGGVRPPVAVATAAGTVNGRAISPKSLDGILFADQFASVQAAIDALPANGGMVVLPANNTDVISTTVSITGNNVILTGQGFSSILQRGTGLTGNNEVLLATGSNVTIENLTVDGNNVSNTSADLAAVGVNNLVRNCQFINPDGTIQLNIGGAGSRASGNVVIGNGGTASQIYGIYGINNATVVIDGNIIENSGIDGIGFNGNGSQVFLNSLTGCHTYTGAGGGSIVWYGTSGTVISTGASIANNVIVNAGSLGSGLEMTGAAVAIANSITGCPGGAVTLFGSGGVLLGNSILNNGSASMLDQVSVQAGAGSFQIVGNTITDTRGGSNSRDSIRVNSGTQTGYAILGNVLAPTIQAGLCDQSTGTGKTILGNVGVDTAPGTVASAATLALGSFNIEPVIALTGSVGVTSITGGWTGRQTKFLPAGAVVFTAGATINNTVTTVANVPLSAVVDAAGKWWLGD